MKSTRPGNRGEAETVAKIQKETKTSQRTLFTVWARLLFGKSDQEIADEYDYKNAETVKSTINRALGKMRDVLTKPPTFETKPPDISYKTPDKHHYFPETFRLDEPDIAPSKTASPKRGEDWPVDGQVRPMISVVCIEGEVIPNYRKAVLPWSPKEPGQQNKTIDAVEDYYRNTLIERFDETTADKIMGIANKRCGRGNVEYGETLEMLTEAAEAAQERQTASGTTPTPSYIAQAADYALRDKQRAERKENQREIETEGELQEMETADTPIGIRGDVKYSQNVKTAQMVDETTEEW